MSAITFEDIFNLFNAWITSYIIFTTMITISLKPFHKIHYKDVLIIIVCILGIYFLPARWHEKFDGKELQIQCIK